MTHAKSPIARRGALFIVLIAGAAVLLAFAARSLIGHEPQGDAQGGDAPQREAPAVFTNEDLATARALRDDALAGTGAFALVEDLTTMVGPRMAGSDGDARAVAWATEVLEGVGFDEVRHEPVRFPTWERGRESAAIVAPAPQPLVIATLGYSPPTPEGGVRAAVVEFEDLDALRAADAEDVEGRIAFIDRRMERTKDGSSYRPAVAARTQGPIVAHEKGAAALLIRSVGTGDHRFAHTGIVAFDFDHYESQLGFASDDRAAGMPLVPSAALAHPDADLLARLLARGDEPVKVQLELGARYGEPYTSHNVIAELRGSERPDEYVLIGAHLDSWDLSPGVLDDAAGVGIVIETARRIAALGERPARTIRLVLFAAEEIGLLGAETYAEEHGHAVDRHLVGSESDFGGGEVYEFRARVRDEAWPALEAMAAELKPLGIELGGRDAFGGPDMTPMRRLGMSVVDLAQDGTYYFDYHHTKDDTLDKVEAEALDQNVAAWLVLTFLAAQSPVDFGSGEALRPPED